MSHKLAVATLSVALMGASHAFAMPQIDILGTDGANHWMWIEAENINGGNMSDPAQLRGQGYNHISGYTAGMDPAPNNIVYRDGSAQEAIWDSNVFHLPAAMSDARLYLKYGSYYETGRTGDYYIDGAKAGSTTFYKTKYASAPGLWAETSLGSISAGGHDFRMYMASYCPLSMDGYYITDGTAQVGSPTAYLVKSGQIAAWREAPISFDNLGTLAAGVAPDVNVQGAMKYSITLNGTAYTPGTPITEPGEYQLVVEAFGGTYSDGYVTIDWDRVLAGANFSIAANPIPEPATMTLLGLGGLALVRRRRNA